MITSRLSRLFGLVALAAGSAAAVAQTPAGGEPVPGPVRAFLVLDERYEATGKKDADPKAKLPANRRNRPNMMHDLVTDNGLNPVVAVFARTVPAAPDAGVAKLAAALDELVAKYRAERLGAFVVFLTLGKEYPDEDLPLREARTEEVRKLAEALKAKGKAGGVPLGLAASKSETTDKWNLKENADVTVVLYNRLQVVKRWELAGDAIGDAQIKEITEAVQGVLKK